MAKTFADIEKALQKFAEKKEQLSSEIQQLKDQADKLTVEAETVAALGDVDQFRSKLSVRSSIETEIRVREIQLAKLKPAFGDGDIEEVWKTVSKTFERDKTRQAEVVDAQRKKLVKEYMELVGLQNDVNRLKGKLEALAGHPLDYPEYYTEKRDHVRYNGCPVSGLVALALETLPEEDPRNSVSFFDRVVANTGYYPIGE